MRRVILIHLMIYVASIVCVQTMALGEELQLTNNSYEDRYPQIHNGQVVWYGSDGSDDEIFYWGGTSVQQLTNNCDPDRNPQIHNGQVVWYGYDGSDREIFYWDGTSVQQLTNNSYNDRNPQIHNGQVVWSGHDGSDREIFYQPHPRPAGPDLSLHLLQVESEGRRWDQVDVKLVIRNRGCLPAYDFYVDIYKHLLSPPEPWWTGDVSRSIFELGPHEGVAYYCHLTYDMDGTYNVYAQVDTDENVVESNEDNNVKGPKEVVIDPDADLDRDGDVDGTDLAMLAASYGSHENDPNFEPLCDFVFDGVIDKDDLAGFAPHFGRVDCPCKI